MGEKRYESLLFGDLSAVTQANRDGIVRSIIGERALGRAAAERLRLSAAGDHAALLAQRVRVPRAAREEEAVVLRELRNVHPLLFDFVLKRIAALSRDGAFPTVRSKRATSSTSAWPAIASSSSCASAASRPLFWTQFLGAANDNLFKFAFTLLATYHAAEWGGLRPGDGGLR